MNESPTRIKRHRRLELISLGSLTATAAAGLTLTEKAEAGIPLASGFFVSNDQITVPDYTYMNLQLDLSITNNPILVMSGSAAKGWNFAYGLSYIIISGNAFAATSYTYWVYSAGFFTATETFNLADYSSDFFAENPGTQFPLPSTTVYFGLRRTGGAAGEINGWLQLEIGSLSHQQSAFNISTPSNIAIGQIPEPTSALLLAAGATGLLTARRRRKD
ncbi:MAG: PEP-CTERM sorting domain-containing protein [Verrucomicrobiota bacterium]